MLSIYRERPDDLDKEMNLILENSNDNILYEIKSIETVKEMMNFYNNHKHEELDRLLYQDKIAFDNIKTKTKVFDINSDSPKKLLTQSDNIDKDPFVLIFSHEIWKWGEIKNYSDCKLQEMIDKEKKEDRQRENEVFNMKYSV